MTGTLSEFMGERSPRSSYNKENSIGQEECCMKFSSKRDFWLLAPSSRALSAHRVEIYYSKFDLIYISPQEREKFIEELGRRSSHLEVRN